MAGLFKDQLSQVEKEGKALKEEALAAKDEAMLLDLQLHALKIDLANLKTKFVVMEKTLANNLIKL